MTDVEQDGVLARIERALTRIETATAVQADASAMLGARHAALRERIGNAVIALDAMIADEGED